MKFICRVCKRITIGRGPLCWACEKNQYVSWVGHRGIAFATMGIFLFLAAFIAACGSESTIQRPPTPSASPIRSPNSASTTVELAANTALPIPPVSGISGTFVETTYTAAPGTTVTLKNSASQPAAAPSPASAPRPGFSYQTLLWVSLTYSSSVFLTSIPTMTWQLPPGFSTSNIQFELAAFDGTTATLMPPDYEVGSVSGRLVSFPGGSLLYCRFGRCSGGYNLTAGHKYWWELIALSLPPSPAPGAITEFPAPSEPVGITAGSDGALWFSEDNLNVGRITLAGAISQFPLLPGSCADATGITSAPDGNVWFTDANCRSMIGKVTPAGVVTEYPLSNALVVPAGIAAGPDNNLWFTESNANKIGRITASGSITEFATSAEPGSIVAGPDGALWFTEPGKVGRITTAGVVTNEYAIPGAVSGPGVIAKGPDGNLWFAGYETCCGFGYNLEGIGKITTAGVVTDYIISPLPYHAAAGIAIGPDGNLWFTEYDIGTSAIENGYSLIGRITTAGSITEFSGLSGHGANQISPGPSGDPHMWFTEADGGIGEIHI
jgi:streptogramin lyase